MTDLPTTARFRLPLLAAAQAQKEITHNEALTLLDALVQPVIEAGPQDDPPSAPTVGHGWLVGGAPTGDWTEATGMIAVYTAGGWRFVEPRAGMRLLRSEAHTSELQSLMRISYAVFCLKTKKESKQITRSAPITNTTDDCVTATQTQPRHRQQH